MRRSVSEIVAQMTLKEKASMCSGKDFWRLESVRRLGVPQVMVADGPHGLRKQAGEADHLGINDSIPAVCFPTACASAASFDRNLLRQLGEALGQECQAEGVAVLLGPAVNIKRSPLCGRNFEYFSEDPYLTGELAASHVAGVQSWNVGACLKHFAANNQEYHRQVASSQVDERTLREIYLPGFEIPVRKSQPWAVMTSYNPVNGVYAGENKHLLGDILRRDWGFKGFVVSDWGAVNHRVNSLKAGMDLEMPGCRVTDKEIERAVLTGRLSMKTLDEAVRRIVAAVLRFSEHRSPAVFDRQAHHHLAAAMAEQCGVLMKNQGGALPLAPEDRVALSGGFAKAPRCQGGGSSHINATEVDDALNWAQKLGFRTEYAEGFSAVSDGRDEAALDEAVRLAGASDAAVVFAGLPDSWESEGYDRRHMRLPACQLELIDRVCAVQKRVIVVLHCGSPVELPFADKVSAILCMYLAGEGVGRAEARLLWGLANPSGKLPETWPVRLQDNPSYLYWPGDGRTAVYGEGRFVGYRYYDKKELGVRFAFGHGLSYTSFAYGPLRLSRARTRDVEGLTASIEITNTGRVQGSEAVQLYVAPEKPGDRPLQELRGFEKVTLAPGEKRTVRFKLPGRAFAVYNEALGGWYVPQGGYRLRAGASSRDVRSEAKVWVQATRRLPFKVTMNTTLGQLMEQDALRPLLQKYLDRYGDGQARTNRSAVAAEAMNEDMQNATMYESPVRALRSFGGVGGMRLQAAVWYLNRKLKKS